MFFCKACLALDLVLAYVRVFYQSALPDAYDVSDHYMFGVYKVLGSKDLPNNVLRITHLSASEFKCGKCTMHNLTQLCRCKQTFFSDVTNLTPCSHKWNKAIFHVTDSYVDVYFSFCNFLWAARNSAYIVSMIDSWRVQKPYHHHQLIYISETVIIYTLIRHTSPDLQFFSKDDCLACPENCTLKVYSLTYTIFVWLLF